MSEIPVRSTASHRCRKRYRRLRHVRIGRRYLVHEGAFEDLIARNTVEAELCQGETKAPGCDFETIAAPTTSAGQTVVAATSARQARQIAKLLKRGSPSIGTAGQSRTSPLKPAAPMCAGACERARLDDVTPHTLRHTCTTWLMQKGIDKWEVCGYLGMTIETLERIYGHHHPDYQRNAAEAF